jgi:hypothetical protein
MSTQTSLPAQQLLQWRSDGQNAEVAVASPLPLTATSRPTARTPGLRPRWGWRGAHPGAGVTTLARELGGADLGMSNVANLPILVVCRSSADGLVAAQRLAAHELSETPSWHCLGLVVVADDRGPLAKALAELAALVAGGYPAHWPIPWVESWRTQQMPTQSVTRPTTKRPAHAAPRRLGRHSRPIYEATKERP